MALLILCLLVSVLVARAGDPAAKLSSPTRLRLVALALGATPIALVLLRGDAVGQKIAGRLAMPMGLIFLATFALAGAAWWRRERLVGASWLLMFFFVGLSGNGYLGSVLIGEIEAEVPVFDLATGERFDAVIVLGGGTRRGPARFELGPSGDRVLLGARLYLEKRTPVLIASGHGIEGISDEDISEQTATIWSELGVPRDAILQLRAPINTSEELAALAALKRERGFARVGLVTSAWHMPRALSLARRLGVEVVPIAADHRGVLPKLGVIELVPSGEGLQRVQTALWELLGRAVGR
ncbi:MAG: YdcF family protein [Deltaproteobacteria bacterium]|nr:YdcF family protein [Deltaproteobacteria bacterium]